VSGARLLKRNTKDGEEHASGQIMIRLKILCAHCQSSWNCRLRKNITTSAYYIIAAFNLIYNRRVRSVLGVYLLKNVQYNTISQRARNIHCSAVEYIYM
jgi:hypothetical protein